jgi:MFS-type transporter involved in bile tolerance (Atg22 family)
MIAEIDVFGVYVPTILVAAIAAYFATSLCAALLTASGFYRLVWHRALFNLALFVCITAAGLHALSRYQP